MALPVRFATLPTGLNPLALFDENFNYLERQIEGVSPVSVCATRVELASVDHVSDPVAILTESGRGGVFQWTAGDFSAQVTSDPAQGLYVAPADAPSGASGVWARQYAGAIGAAWFGVKFDGSGENTAAFLAMLSAAAGKVISLPAGTVQFTGANPAIVIPSNTTLVGAGMYETTLRFTGLSAASNGIAADTKSGITIRDLSIVSSAALSGNQSAVYFLNCNDCLLERVRQLNFSQGLVFDATNAPTYASTVGLRNKMIDCVSSGSRGFGMFMQAQLWGEWRGCEVYSATNLDGFKLGRGSLAMRIDGCISQGNAGDGFDTYDGFIDGVMTNCIAVGNTNAGYQFKGTLGGTYASGDYVTRESTVSNCIAIANGINGFLFQETRNLVLSNLMSVGNTGFGFCFNNTQGITATTLHALRNTTDGINLQGNTSRCTFTGCIAEDNSYVDGVVQNGIYSGFHLQACSNCLFSNCFSLNGTQAGKLGGQKYGFNTNTSVNNTISNYQALANVTGPVGGTNPYSNNNFGHLLETMSIRRVNGSPEGVVTAPVGSLALRDDGGAGTTMYLKESGTGNVGWVAK